ncbi:class I SAM-dependent methyltransferase [Aminobacter sp. UC22_36]|uniref:class I SAM-dependent methyltransferase n=1 Tax=Aminobacter sp. UC22_36 TaxID=3374549 RepID=UPI003757E08A
MTQFPREAILAEASSYYTAKLAQHGATPQGVDWNGELSHHVRHHQFLRLLAPDPAASVLDLGCGYGDFLVFLRQSGHNGQFIGYDVSSAMIAEAERLHGIGEDRLWHVGAEPTEPADYATASGILNVKGEIPTAEWDAYVRDTMLLLGRSSRRGFAANMLSLSSDPEKRRSNLHYVDPTEMLRFCMQHFGRSVALLQDYGLYEFTIIVRHT